MGRSEDTMGRPILPAFYRGRGGVAGPGCAHQKPLSVGGWWAQRTSLCPAARLARLGSAAGAAVACGAALRHAAALCRIAARGRCCGGAAVAAPILQDWCCGPAACQVQSSDFVRIVRGGECYSALGALGLARASAAVRVMRLRCDSAEGRMRGRHGGWGWVRCAVPTAAEKQ